MVEMNDVIDKAEGNGRYQSPHRTPIWVKVLGMIAVVLLLLFVVLMLVGGGEHGPGRHTASTGITENVAFLR